MLESKAFKPTKLTGIVIACAAVSYIAGDRNFLTPPLAPVAHNAVSNEGLDTSPTSDARSSDVEVEPTIKHNEQAAATYNSINLRKRTDAVLTGRDPEASALETFGARDEGENPEAIAVSYPDKNTAVVSLVRTAVQDTSVSAIRYHIEFISHEELTLYIGLV